MNRNETSLPPEDKKIMENETRDYEEDKRVTQKMQLVVNQRTDVGEQNKTRERKDFPWKLHVMLEEAETEHNQNIVSWDPDGICFTVFKQEEFVKQIMPRYFKQTLFRSFQRMLNLYNFLKVMTGPFRGAYTHPKFIKRDRSLCLQMKIWKKRNKSVPAAASLKPSNEACQSQYFGLAGRHFQELPSNERLRGADQLGGAHDNLLPIPFNDSFSDQKPASIDHDRQRVGLRHSDLLPPQYLALQPYEKEAYSVTVSERLHPSSCSRIFPLPAKPTNDTEETLVKHSLPFASRGTSGERGFHSIHMLPATWDSNTFRDMEGSNKSDHPLPNESSSLSKGSTVPGVLEDTRKKYSNNFSEPLSSDLEPTPLPPSF